MRTVVLHVPQFEFPNCGCCFQCCVSKEKGVLSVETNIIDMEGTVHYDETIWSDETKLIKRIQDLGFEVTKIHN